MSQTRLLSLLATLIAVPVSAQGGTACLQGRVYGAAGSPLLGARVLLLNTGAAVATDIEGRFAFPELRPDTVSVRVTYIGYKSGMVTGLQLSVGRTVLQDFTLEESKVTISETGGAPPPGMVGNAARPQPAKPTVSERTCPHAPPSSKVRMVDGVPVDSNGRALQLVPVYEQPPRLGSNPSNRNVYVDGVPVQRTRQPVSGTACLQGRVFSSPGVPLAGARVVLLNPQIATVTDGYGQYSFWSLAPDTVSVRVASIGYKAAVVSGLRLSADRIVSQDFTLESTPVTVTESTPPPGMVGRQASAPSAARPVEASLCEATPSKPEVMRLPDGSYVDKLPVDNVSRVSTGVAPGTIIPSPGRLEGTVMAEGRQPLWGARVFIVGSRASVTTDSSGRYRFEAVPAGVITVQAMAIASKSATVAGLRIRPGEHVTQDFVLASQPEGENSMNRTSGTRPEVTYVDGIPNGGQAPYPNPGRLEGIVRDAANRAVVDAVVAVVGTMESARTDSTGRYVLPLVPSGVLALRVTRAGYAPTMVEGLRLRQGETILQDFHLAPAAPARP